MKGARLFPPSLQVFMCINKVSPEPFLLHGKWSQLSQLFFIGGILWSLSSLWPFVELAPYLILGSPDLGNTVPNAAQDTICLLFCRDTCLSHVQLFVHQDPQVFSCQAALQLGSPQRIQVPRVLCQVCSHLLKI